MFPALSLDIPPREDITAESYQMKSTMELNRYRPYIVQNFRELGLEANSSFLNMSLKYLNFLPTAGLTRTIEGNHIRSADNPFHQHLDLDIKAKPKSEEIYSV